MKKILATLLLGLALTVAALAAAAETSGSPVTLTATDGGASVRLDLPADTVQGVKALRLRFAVESADPVEADFAFDSALPGSVQQYRYDAATGTMTVYVAGGRELFPQGTASLGSIQVDVPAGGTATVHLVENSLELVNGAFGRTEAPAVGPVSVEVSAAEETPAPTPTPDPKPTQTPAEKPTQQNTAGQQSGNTQSTQSASNAAPTATPAAPAATAQAPVPSAGSGQTAVSGNSGGTKKPAKGSGSASTETQVTPNPTEVPAATATSAPDEQPAVTPAPATPEQAETAAAPAVNLPLAALIAVACLAVVVLIGIAVIRFRSR